MKGLFVDHRDSFSLNLAAALRVAGLNLSVIQACDLPSSSAELAALAGEYDVLVLSPGPGNPSEYPNSSALYRSGFVHKPVLGVCLGLQIVLENDGFCVERICANPNHGRQCELELTGAGSQFDLSGFWVFYNSLGCLESDEALASRGWRVLAREGAAIAAVCHSEMPHVLVQFHPESFASVGGEKLIRDFVAQISIPGISF